MVFKLSIVTTILLLRHSFWAAQHIKFLGYPAYIYIVFCGACQWGVLKFPQQSVSQFQGATPSPPAWPITLHHAAGTSLTLKIA